MPTFLSIEHRLRKINNKGLIEEFKESEELKKAGETEKLVIEGILNKHDWSAADSYHKYLAGSFDSACCKILNESMDKPNKTVEDLAQKILKVIDDFSRRMEIGPHEPH